MEDRVFKILGNLRKAGYKLTPQRRLILEQVLAGDGYQSAADVHRAVRAKRPSVSLTTVYRTLETLADLTLISRIVSRRCVRYGALEGPHHHHLICSGCGKIVEFTSCNFASIETELSKAFGFEIEYHSLSVYGICPGCGSRSEAFM